MHNYAYIYVLSLLLNFGSKIGEVRREFWFSGTFPQLSAKIARVASSPNGCGDLRNEIEIRLNYHSGSDLDLVCFRES